MRPLALAVLLLASAAALAQPAATDLCLDKIVDDPDAVIGQEATFFIALTNRGETEATGIEVGDVLPEGLAFAGWSATDGAYDPATGTWSLAALAPGQTATLALSTTVTSASPVENCASLQALDQYDYDPENDTDCATVFPRPAAPDGLASRAEPRAEAR